MKKELVITLPLNMKESIASFSPACNKLSGHYKKIKIILIVKGKFSKNTLVIQVVSVIRYGKKIKLGILTTSVDFNSLTLGF